MPNYFWSVLFDVLGVFWVLVGQGLRPSAEVPVVPLGDAPAGNPVHRDLAEPLQDPSLPLPPQEDLHGVEGANLKSAGLVLSQFAE